MATLKLRSFLIPTVILMLFLLVAGAVAGFMLPVESLLSFASAPISSLKNYDYLKNHSFNIGPSLNDHRLSINYYEPFVKYSKVGEGVDTLNLNLVEDSGNFASTLSDDKNNTIVKYNTITISGDKSLTLNIYVSDQAMSNLPLTNQILSFLVLDTFSKVNVSKAGLFTDFDADRVELQDYLKKIRLSSVKNFPISFQ